MNLLDFVIAPAMAQAAPAAGQPSMMGTLLFPVVLIAIMYFLMIRPQIKRQKEHRAMVEKLAVGDEVITNGGVAGTIRQVGESFVTVEIADGVQVKVQKAAVGNVLPRGTLRAA